MSSFSIIPGGKFTNAIQTNQIVSDTALISGVLQVNGPCNIQDLICDNLTIAGAVVSPSIIVNTIQYTVGQLTGDHSFNGNGVNVYSLNVFNGASDSTVTLPTLGISSNVGISMTFVNKSASNSILTIVPFAGEKIDDVVDSPVVLNNQSSRVTLISVANSWYVA